jgi:hypothetical protein
MRDRVTRSEIGHIFVGVTRAGAASGRPYGEKSKGERKSKCDGNLKFQIEIWGNGDGKKCESRSLTPKAGSG